MDGLAAMTPRAAGRLSLAAAAWPVARVSASEALRDLCVHGAYNRTTGACVCDDGWRPAGPTDTLNYLKGVCTQFACSSSRQCRERLGLPGASCPVQGWDCYCGWAFAFRGTGSAELGLSAGYQTWGPESAACQGPIFTLQFSISWGVFWVLQNFWKVVLLASFLLLPFGQTKVRCQCYDPGMFRLALALLRRGRDPGCNGQCTVRGRFHMIYYDLAWFLYALDVGIWLYAFLLVTWISFLVFWGIFIWLMVLVLLLMTLCSSLVCAGGGDSGSGGCECFQGGADGGCQNGCLFCENCCQGYMGAGGLGEDPTFDFYSGGPMPGGGERRCCACLNWCCLCLPLAKLLLQFPRRPSNMWGGLCGYLFLGTHPRSRVPYSGGSRLVDFLGFRGESDLHDRQDWRRRFANFLQAGTDGARRQPLPGQAPGQQEMPADGNGWVPAQGWGSRPSASESEGQIAGRHIVKTGQPFDRERDNCRNTSFEDYQKEECWICCDSKDQREWDLWLQCGHLFCSRCSTEMLRRKLPCPLCRQVSWSVKRGPPPYCPPAAP